MKYNIEADGWCTGARRIDSPNFDARPANTDIDLLVIHNISLPPGQFGGDDVCRLFSNTLDCDAHPYFDRLRELKVSAHFLIQRDGTLIQFVSTLMRAWHAGLSEFESRQRCNDFSIGIELEGTDDLEFEAIQYDVLSALSAAICATNSISAIRGHEHIAPGRKTDPGPCFHWGYYRKCLIQLNSGLSSALSWPQPSNGN